MKRALDWVKNIYKLKTQGYLFYIRVRSGSAFAFPKRTLFLFFSFFYAFLANFFTIQSLLRLLFTAIFDFLPTITLFSNFFIKNGSYSTIHTFKNYFATVFFSFQFPAVSKRSCIIGCLGCLIV